MTEVREIEPFVYYIPRPGERLGDLETGPVTGDCQEPVIGVITEVIKVLK